MAGLKDRVKKEINPVEKTVLDIAGKKIDKKKEKYAVNVVFKGSMEAAIKERADELGMGVATYIKMLVSKDLNRE